VLKRVGKADNPWDQKSKSNGLKVELKGACTGGLEKNSGLAKERKKGVSPSSLQKKARPEVYSKSNNTGGEVIKGRQMGQNASPSKWGENAPHIVKKGRENTLAQSTVRFQHKNPIRCPEY